MKRVLVTYAMAKEMLALAPSFSEQSFLNLDIQFLYTGIGPFDTAIHLAKPSLFSLRQSKFVPDCIVNIGYAGGAYLEDRHIVNNESKAPHIGDAFEVTKVGFRDYESSVMGTLSYDLSTLFNDNVPKAKCLTSSTFYVGDELSSSNVSDSALIDDGYTVFDMELASLVHTVRSLGQNLPIYSYKVISDNCSYSQYQESTANPLQSMTDILVKVLFALDEEASQHPLGFF